MSTKEQILTTALPMFVANGFHGTPTAKIAIEAKVANGTLFYHYKTKEDLVVALYNKLKAEQAKHILPIIKGEGFITNKFRSIFIQSVDWALTNPDKFYYIQQFHFSPHYSVVAAETLKGHTVDYADFIAEGIRRKLLKQQPVELVMSLFNGQGYGIYQYLIAADFATTNRNKIIDDAYAMTWDMMKYM